jgi:predicted RNase H-like HicB family nuclease
LKCEIGPRSNQVPRKRLKGSAAKNMTSRAPKYPPRINEFRTFRSCAKNLAAAVAFLNYISEVLKNAVYEKGEQLDVIVAEVPDLPGCLTQSATFKEARENLLDAIEVWLMTGLRSGEDPPVVNGYCLDITAAPFDAEWLTEVKRRAAQIDSGKSKLSTWEQVRQRARRR